MTAKHGWLVLWVLLAGGLSFAGEKPINQSWRGIAVEGYDMVAYFTAGVPTEGKKEFSFSWQGATWLFSSAANQAAFAKEPSKYAPQYGGYCAYAVSQNSTAGIDPQAWRIVDGKLYLNYNLKIQKTWEASMAAFIAAADKNWPGLVEKE